MSGDLPPQHANCRTTRRFVRTDWKRRIDIYVKEPLINGKLWVQQEEWPIDWTSPEKTERQKKFQKKMAERSARLMLTLKISREAKRVVKL